MTNLVSSILSFFSLETLDTRLHAPSNTERKQAIIARANPTSKWNTLEYKFYALVFIVTVPLMYKTAMDASNETNPNYPKFEHLLSQGWMFGRKVDNSDQQYRFFRNNIPMLFGMIVLHTCTRRVLNWAFQIKRRTSFDFIFGLGFLVVAHGTNCFKILLHIAINYIIGRYITNRKIAILVSWVYGILSLFLNDAVRNTPYGIGFLDNGYKGLVPRWDVFFNFTLLRMLSFNFDYLERKQKLSEDREKSAGTEMGGGVECLSLNLPPLDDRSRLTAPLPLSDYSIPNYIAYVLYTPLFIAGPVVTFNDFIYQSNYNQVSSVKNYKRTFIYFLRLVFCILVMEFLLHFMYVVAVSKTKAWQGDTPFQISMIGLFNLNLIWLKLLIPWRIFRFWSLLDGIDPPENMIRCMDNNYSALAFWRAWHRSYNRWVVRYIYVPLGGGGNYRIVNSLCVFSFVAVWHDIELKMLMWGWLVVIFLLPELGATMYFKRFQNQWWYNYLCGIGAVANIWMMMLANLFGFCLGKDGTLDLLLEMFGTVSGIEFFILSLGALFVGSQVMFELRESEMRRGVNVRC